MFSEFESLEPLIGGDTTYTLPVPAPDTCGWCHGLICAVHFPTRDWINVDVVADADGTLRANLLHEHRCEPVERYAQRPAARDDAWEGEDAE
ncbi:MAG: hypothetical protein WCD02_18765 [Terriglobales bacterium]